VAVYGALSTSLLTPAAPGRDGGGGLPGDITFFLNEIIVCVFVSSSGAPSTIQMTPAATAGGKAMFPKDILFFLN